MPLDAVFEGAEVMPVDIIDDSGKLLQLKIRETLEVADHRRTIENAKQAIPGGKNPRARHP
jgi:hypothetical protein